ncbi:hypothetical protein [Actinopolymorpha rutila]|uniref:hypothetical protein n=1 Tax=Actinopolymorpha rutila TaxID=446787 RepID=UPI0015CE613B|nr:hypothetical protein [Actinopolymorpha rutila]
MARVAMAAAHVDAVVVDEPAVIFEGCRPWTEPGASAYEPDLLDGKVLHFHDMDLLRIEVEPELRRLTLWFRWDSDWLPTEFRDTPVARLDVHGARVVAWDEEPVEDVPAGVGREVRALDFQPPNLVHCESYNIGFTAEVRRVVLAVLPSDATSTMT